MLVKISGKKAKNLSFWLIIGKDSVTVLTAVSSLAKFAETSKDREGTSDVTISSSRIVPLFMMSFDDFLPSKRP